MSFASFKIIYLTISVLSAAVATWLLRKSKDDLLALGLHSFIFLMFFLVLYVDASQDIPDTLFAEHVFGALTHLKPDLMLTLCNVLFWGLFPIGIGMFLMNKKHGTLSVWIFLGVLTLIKTFFEDYFLIHTYPEALFHSFEWGSVLLAWLIIYSLVGFFITKGIALLKETKNDDQSTH